MIEILTFLIIAREFIKNNFNKYDYHSIFRSFFCLSISTLSAIVCFIYWDALIANPLSYNVYSYIINTFVLIYMLYDIVYFIYKKKIRADLMFHHIVCAIIFLTYRRYFILTFVTIAEIISAFNWIGLIYPTYDYITKNLRLASILFVRLWLWLYSIVLLYNTSQFYFILALLSIFFGLDIYWLHVIHNNYYKRAAYIKKNKMLAKQITKCRT